MTRLNPEHAALPAPRVFEVALLASVFVVAACGLVYELAAGALASFVVVLLVRGVNRVLAEARGVSVEEIARDTERDNFKSAFEAQAYGLVDQVLERRPDESIQAG